MNEDRKKIVKLVCSNHSPFDTRIFEKEARALQSFGFEVVIIIPCNKSGYYEGIEIISIKNPVNGWDKLFLIPFKIFLKAIKIKDADAFHIHDSEILITGLLLKLLGKKVIYDAHEDTPNQIRYQHWLPNVIKPFYILYYRILEWISGLLFDKIIVAEPIIAQYYPKNKTSLIRNFPIASRIPENLSWEKRKNQAVYIGGITKVRGYYEMVEAFERQRSNIKLVLGGKFSPERIKKHIDQNPNIEFVGWLSLNSVNKLLSESKLGLIIPHPVKRYLTNYPVKLFEYMLAGLPVIVSENSESEKFVKESNCGFAVNPLDTQAIANAINELFDNQEESSEMGKRGRQLVLDKYNWEQESIKLLALYQDLFRKNNST